MKKNNWYFITDDTQNEKNKFFFNYLENQSKDGLILLTPDYCPKNAFGIPQEYFKVKDNKRLNLVWAKFSFLFAKTANSSSDIHFPERNIYNNFLYLNKIVNLFWYLKRLINRCLPNYEYLFFKGIKSQDYELEITPHSVFVYDSIILRHVRYASLIKFLKMQNSVLHSVVSSWDNPFYTQFSGSAKKYFIWSEQMLEDITLVHDLDIPKNRIELVGPFPFYDFYKSRRNNKITDNMSKTIGYACAFCDVIFLHYEIQLIKKLAKIAGHLDYQILVRPYPSLPINEYDELKDIQNVTLYLQKDAVYEDRYGDGREFILFSSNEERHQYLSLCSLFISTGTSFSIEAAIDNIPILHIYLDAEMRKEVFEKEFFGRIEISDHILKYLNKNLHLINSYEDLQLILHSLEISESYSTELQVCNGKLLNALGFNNFDYLTSK